MTQTALQQRYMNDAVSTVSPAKLVLMLYDRLVKDLEDAEQAINGRHIATASDKLVHAQDIIMELHSGLNVDAWSGGPGLASLYLWFHGELIRANVAKDTKLVAAVRKQIEPLRDAWHQAAKSPVDAGA
jgi:flagellar secretion chaperone FliS